MCTSTALTRRLHELSQQLSSQVAADRWTDATLSAAAMWQAADDRLNRTQSPVVAAAALFRGRALPAGRLTGVAADALADVIAAAARARPRRTEVERWRHVLTSLGSATADLAGPLDDDRRRERTATARRLAAELGPPPRELGDAVNRVPSAFRAFDQHPDDIDELVARVAARWPDRRRPVVVAGVRTSGSYLAFFTAAALRRAGFDRVDVVSGRPGQRFLPDDARLLHTARQADALALVVDDPPASGGAVAGVCDALTGVGFPAGSVVAALALFEDAPDAPAALSAFPVVTLPWGEWSIHRRLGPGQTARALGPAFPAGRVAVEAELPVARDLPRTHARKLFRITVSYEDRPAEQRCVLAVGTGLGYLGAHDVTIAHALKGRVPDVLGHADSVLYLDWPENARPVVPAPDEVVDYIAARHAALPSPEDPTPALRGSQPVWEVASNHLARVYGRFWPVARIAVVDRLTQRLLRTTEPSLPDGDMRPATWLVGDSDEQPVKTSFAERSFANFDLASFDDRFDVVGAAVHTDDPGYTRQLRTGYERTTGRRLSAERWLAYELVHLWDLERLAGLDPFTTRERKSQALRAYLAEVLLADLPETHGGPVVALDVDGVLETDLLGFKAPTPSSVLSLRALRAHGYRTALVTGRCLDDVVAMSEVFGLAGGAAEYGSVVYDRSAAAVTSLVDDAGLAELASLRGRLEPLPDVRVDPRHRHSVRVSAVGGSGEPTAFTPPPALVPDRLRAVPGEEQTDYVVAGVDKAVGARDLLGRLGVDRPVLAVGDTVADVGLLRWSPLSVVPRHADTATRAAASRVARHPYQGGLADAVRELVGHRPGGCPACAPPEQTPETRTVLRLLAVAEGGRGRALARSVPLLWADPHVE